MNQGKYIFSQLTDLISHKRFQTIVNRHKGDYKTREFTCWKQFLCMSFGQLTHRESISDLMLCLKANTNKLYHLGVGQSVAVSTLTRANEQRSYLIYEELALMLITQARCLCQDQSDLDLNIKHNVFALDATTIDLCLSTFYWAAWRRAKAGIRLHTQLDLKNAIPKFILFTTASVHDVNMLDHISYESNSFYVMDRGYLDFKRLNVIHSCNAFFVIRAKNDMKYKTVRMHSSECSKGVVCDQIIALTGQKSTRTYPEELRRIEYCDPISKKKFVFLTNNLELDPFEVASLYKNRWKIELFFKWIKQHLKIKAFWGYSENAVKTQVWIAICCYVLLVIAKKKFVIKQSLYEIMQVVSVSAFEKIPINQLFTDMVINQSSSKKDNQLKIWQ